MLCDMYMDAVQPRGAVLPSACYAGAVLLHGFQHIVPYNNMAYHVHVLCIPRACVVHTMCMYCAYLVHVLEEFARIIEPLATAELTAAKDMAMC